MIYLPFFFAGSVGFGATFAFPLLFAGSLRDGVLLDSVGALDTGGLVCALSVRFGSV